MHQSVNTYPASKRQVIQPRVLTELSKAELLQSPFSSRTLREAGPTPVHPL